MKDSQDYQMEPQPMPDRLPGQVILNVLIQGVVIGKLDPENLKGMILKGHFLVQERYGLLSL